MNRIGFGVNRIGFGVNRIGFGVNRIGCNLYEYLDIHIYHCGLYADKWTVYCL